MDINMILALIFVLCFSSGIATVFWYLDLCETDNLGWDTGDTVKPRFRVKMGFLLIIIGFV